MSLAIERKLEIAEDKSLNPLVRAITAYLNCKSSEYENKLLDDALQAISLFSIREVELANRLEQISSDSQAFVEVIGRTIVDSKSHQVDRLQISKQNLLNTQQDQQYRSECAQLAADLSNLQPRHDLEQATLTARGELLELSSTAAMQETTFNKRLRKLDYIMSTALELKS